MARLNTTQTVRPVITGPIRGEHTPTGTTHEGAPGYARDAKSELFLRAVSTFAGERTFYEDAAKAGNRYVQLVRQVAGEDPAWCVAFLGWLRDGGHMRTSAIIGAAEFVRARLEDERIQAAAPVAYTAPAPRDLRRWNACSFEPGENRRAIASVLQRADEPGELLAYWTSRYGMAIPKPVKRGIGDAIGRLWTERSVLKWDSAERPFRFGRILDLCHPESYKPNQGDLFTYLLDRMHKRVTNISPRLPMIRAREKLMRVPAAERRATIQAWGHTAPVMLRDAGMTWEALAGWLEGPMDAYAWEQIIPSMRYGALLKNLRNFDQAGVSDRVAGIVAQVLLDGTQVQRAKVFPMQLLAAYRAIESDRWAWPLEQALGQSLINIPQLTGRTLVLVDTSTSMNASFSKDGKLARWDAAVIFALAAAARCAAADVVSFSSAAYYMNDQPGAKTAVFERRAGESLLRGIARWKNDGYFLGGGTDTAAALRKHYNGHDRVLILTDEQAAKAATEREVSASIPANVPLYTWNLAGYERGHTPAGERNRHTFGGLTDACFQIVDTLEHHREGRWPWDRATPAAAR